MIKTIYSEYIEDIISFVKTKHKDEYIEILDEDEKDIFDILNILENIDILNQNKIFIIRNPNKILKKIDSIQTDNTLYLYTPKNIKNIDKETISKYNPKDFIKNKFKESNISITDNIIGEIIDIIGDDKIVIQNEIKKCIYFIYPKKEITNIDDIKDILSENDNTVIWNITNALMMNNKNLMIKEFTRLISQNEDLYMITSMLLREIYILILIYNYKNETNSNIVSLLKQKPFKINISEYGVLKAKENLYRFEENKLRETYHRILKLITLANSGKIDMNLSLLILFLTI
ncbi:hypothetical protein M1145_00670 [Patescibacteria group bacterium]|nr:hypothetical protein [Patescibacteria group bacterium]